jgi:GH25 family lysozyme M1 (1,4-beta-N-acetylmuramidase)
VGGALIILAGLAVPLAVTAGGAAAAAPLPQGTDISNLTTVTSWPDVAAAGMSFVGIEAIQGKGIPNTQYNAQVTGATSAGLYVMPYVFADPGKISGSTQFTDAWNIIKAVPGIPYARGGKMLPIALDMELDSVNFPGDPCYGMKTTAAMVTWISDFITAAKAQTGAVPVIYSSPGWWLKCTGNTTEFDGDPLWIAHYAVKSPAIPPGWPGYTFWQSSPSGSLQGIKGAADLDQMQGAPATLTAARGTGGSLQVWTLNALAGQAVTYSATGVNLAGLAVSSGGLFTWTPATAVGSYPVTVTPSSSADLPSAVSFTLHVHAAITVASPGNRVSTAGSPVALRIAASGPDQSAGFGPSFKASGLPAGVSMDSTGRMTGWVSRPGTFKVTVTASDGLGGTGSTSFTWTIRAAADSGFAGAIRQAGGTAKCLNDPAASTANGTPVNLWTCTGHANQNWTVVKDGTIRVLGKCLDVVGEGKANGTKLQIWACNSGDGGQLWQAGTDGQLVNPQSGKCLYVPVSKAVNGTQPVLWTCANVTTQPNEHWLRPAANVYSGTGRCLAASGTAAVAATCATTAAQHWTAQPDGTIRVGGKCLTEAGTTARSVLVIGSCSGAAATKWTMLSAGPIATELAGAAPGLCASVPPSGAALILQACAPTPATTWHVE